MAGFISTVRFLVKEECVDEFIRMHNSPDGINQNLSFLKQKIRHSDKQNLIEVVKSIKSVE